MSLIAVGIYLFCFGYSVSLGPIVWLYNAEILPEKGVSLATLTNWSTVIIITFLFPVINGALGTYSPVFFFFAFCCVCCLIFVFFLIRETKGLSARNISLLFSTNTRIGRKISRALSID